MDRSNRHSLAVTDHAVVRYLERRLGVDVELIRRQILEDIDKPRILRMVEFAAGERCKVISGKGTYCIRNGAVTTFY